MIIQIAINKKNKVKNDSSNSYILFLQRHRPTVQEQHNSDVRTANYEPIECK